MWTASGKRAHMGIAGWVLAFDRKENHDGEGRNVLFIGCNVEWMREERFRRELQRTLREAAARGVTVEILGANEAVGEPAVEPVPAEVW